MQNFCEVLVVNLQEFNFFFHVSSLKKGQGPENGDIIPDCGVCSPHGTRNLMQPIES
jgi:hypothetical protein